MNIFKLLLKFYFAVLSIRYVLTKIIQVQSLVKRIKFLDLKKDRRMHNLGLDNSVAYRR